MPGFKFKFAKALKVKERTEDMRRYELLRLRAMEENEKRLLQRMEEARADVQAAQREEMRGTVTVERLRLYGAYGGNLNTQISGQAQRLMESSFAVEAGREKLIAAQQETLVLNKLKDKHRARHMLRENRAEQKLLDEAAGNNYRRVIESGV